MMPLLLDASVWLASRDTQDRHHAAAQRLIDGAADEFRLAALDLTLYEVANVAVTRWRSPENARSLVSLVRKLCSEEIACIDEELSLHAIAVATEHRLSVYDATYVAVAERHDWTLVSGDHADLVGPGLAVAPDAVPD